MSQEGVLNTLKANIGVSSLAQITLQFLRKLASSLGTALDNSLCADLHTHLQSPPKDAFESSLHHAYIWRSYPSPPVPEMKNQDTIASLGCFDDEKKGLDVGAFVCWIADHVFPLLGNEALLVLTVPLAEDLINILLHPGCTGFYSGVNSQILSNLCNNNLLFWPVLRFFVYELPGAKSL